MAHPALPIPALLGAPIAGSVIGIVLAIQTLVVRILRPPLPVAVAACLPVLRIGAVLAAVIIGLPVPLTVG